MDDMIALALRWITLNEAVWPNEVQIARALIAAHERIKELEAKQSWQPIETAPRDGSVVDVWLGDADRPSIHFYCGDGTKRAPSWHFKDGKFRPVLGGLRMPVFVEPTHWTPLPEPPK